MHERTIAVAFGRVHAALGVFGINVRNHWWKRSSMLRPTVREPVAPVSFRIRFHHAPDVTFAADEAAQ
jgi:hypothetical protein